MNFDDELDLGTLDSAPENIPQVVIVNETSKAAKQGGIVGQLNVTGTNTNVKSFTAVPLNVKARRIWFMGNGTSYFCRSEDSIKPVASDSEHYRQQSADCRACPKAKWRGRTNPPECQNSLDVTMAVLTDGLPKVVEMSFKSSSMKAIKNALELMSEKGGLTSHKFNIESMIVEGRNFDYFVAVVDKVTPLTDAEKKSIVSLVSKYSPKTDHIHLEKPAEIEISSDEVSSFSKDLIEIDLE